MGSCYHTELRATPGRDINAMAAKILGLESV